MFGLGAPELVLIFVVILLLFGGKKLPELARGLGKGIREFKKAKDDIGDTMEREADDIARDEQQKKAAKEAEIARIREEERTKVLAETQGPKPTHVSPISEEPKK
jgi:sec-independent protein translocase protein TatA